MLALLGLARLVLFWPRTADVLSDSELYLREPLSLWGDANRSPLGGWFFQAMAEHLTGIAITQHLLGTASWLFLAVAAARCLGLGSGIAVVLASATFTIASWDNNLLLESFCLSGVIAWLGFAVLEAKSAPSRLRRTAWMLIPGLLVLARPSLFPAWCGLLLIQAAVLWRERPRSSVQPVALALACVAFGAPFTIGQARVLGGWQSLARSYGCDSIRSIARSSRVRRRASASMRRPFRPSVTGCGRTSTRRFRRSVPSGAPG